MARLKSCLLVLALVCSAIASCAATPRLGDHLVRSGVPVHVESIGDNEDAIIKIRNRLPTEDKDTVRMSCTAELGGNSIGDLELTEVSPYAVYWTAHIYGPADLWSCEFEWVDHNLVIGKTDVWKNEDNIIWMIDASGLELFDASSDSYKFISGWEKKSSGTAASA